MQYLHLILEWSKQEDINLSYATCTKIPISVDYVEFERRLCAMCYSCFIREGSQVPFEKFFGDCLGTIQEVRRSFLAQHPAPRISRKR